MSAAGLGAAGDFGVAQQPLALQNTLALRSHAKPNAATAATPVPPLQRRYSVSDPAVAR